MENRKVRIHTLGCKVNQYESEALLKLFKEAGITPAADNEPADIVVVNSCTVTAQSDQKVRQTLRRARKDDPEAVIVLTGCMAQAFPEMAEKLPEANIILGTANRGRLLKHVNAFSAGHQRIVDISPHEQGEKFEAMSISSFNERTRAFVKIEDGCDRFCSYCIIPYARGRVRSKNLCDITAEVADLGRAGYKEVVLTGINLSAYGRDIGADLCDAVEAACADGNIRRVRLGSLEPEQLTEKVIRRLSAQEKLCPQFHLSLQSGCDETLRRMNRHYTSAQYKRIVENLRAAFESAAITTDIMVGFPGESEEEFEQSLAFAEEIAFAKVHVFAYSRRPGTLANNFENQVPKKVKEQRSKRMIAVTERTRAEFYAAQVGKTEPVLFERETAPGVYEGHTVNYTPVAAALDGNLKGQILNVRITAAQPERCVGEVE